MSNQTEKFDWYTKLLSEHQHILVSDDDAIQKMFGVETGGEFSLRYVGNKSMGYKVVIIAKHPDDIVFLNRYPEEVMFISRMARMLFKQRVPIITCKSELSASIANAKFGVFEVENKSVIECSADELAKKVFFTLDSRLVNNVGEVKELNKSINDDFQLFTRQKLSKYLVANDIDALMTGGLLLFIELKRIDEAFNDLADWMPYLDDFSNYSALHHISKTLEGSRVRVIAYPKNKSSMVAIHEIDHMDDAVKNGKETVRGPRIKGRRLLCAVASSVRHVLGDEYISDSNWRKKKPVAVAA